MLANVFQVPKTCLNKHLLQSERTWAFAEDSSLVSRTNVSTFPLHRSLLLSYDLSQSYGGQVSDQLVLAALTHTQGTPAFCLRVRSRKDISWLDVNGAQRLGIGSQRKRAPACHPLGDNSRKHSLTSQRSWRNWKSPYPQWQP